MEVCQSERKVPITQCFGCRLLLRFLLPLTQGYLGLWHKRTEKRKKKEFPHSQWGLGVIFPTPWARTSRLLLELSVYTWMPTCGLQIAWVQARGYRKETNGKLTASLMVLHIILFFLNTPVVIYSSESSYSFPSILSSFYRCIRWERVFVLNLSHLKMKLSSISIISHSILTNTWTPQIKDIW